MTCDLPTTDPETGLPDVRRLLEALRMRPFELRCVEVFAIGGPSGIEEPFALAGDPELGRRAGAALRDAAARHGGEAFRLGGTVYAMLLPADVPAGTSAAAAHDALARSWERFSGGVLAGRVTVPVEAPASLAAVRLAYRRMHARAGWHPLAPGRQVRDVLLALLAERLPPGAKVRRPEVSGHAVAVARRLGFRETELNDLLRAAELQDVGMLVLPSALLDKRAPLTSEEWAIIRHHPVVGERALAASPALASVARIVRSCYERFDGTGYPDGLRAEEIPLSARIVSVCVAYDAMTSRRPYRPPLSPEAALLEISRCAGTQFDPRIVAIFHDVVGAFMAGPAQQVA